ncbi:hypothetical protein ACWCO3_31980 [Micromonospora sp. NPDC002411]
MSQDKGVLGITTEQFDRVLKTNLYAMFWLCKAAVPHLTEGAAIITRRRSRRSTRRRSCWITRSPPTWPSRASGSTRSHPARSGRR